MTADIVFYLLNYFYSSEYLTIYLLKILFTHIYYLSFAFSVHLLQAKS